MIPKFFLALVFCFISSTQIAAAPGDLDLTFGIAGRALSSVGKISFDQGRAAALQADGKIVVIGDSVSDGQYWLEPPNLTILRLNPDGSRDSSFGIGGLVVKRLRSFVNGASVVIQTDGKIVVGGFIIQEISPGVNKRAFLLVRLLSSGASDASFGVDGRVISVLDSAQDTTLTSLALQSDGKIVAAGFSGTPNSPLSLIAARYNADGQLDSSFDGDGKQFINVNPAGNRGNTVKIQSDEKIVIGGSLRETTGTITDFLLVRLNTDGSLDNTFDGDGKLTTKIATSTSAVNALSFQSDGKVIAVGNSNVGANRSIGLARYNGNGSLDSSFDGDGIVVTDILDELASSAAIQPDGKILVGGQAILAPNTPFHYLLSRYNSDGSPDLSFDGDGRVITSVTMLTDRPNALLLQGDGRIVLSGYSIDITNSDVSLARYNTDGSLDGTFDGDGKAIHELGNAGDGIHDTAIQPDGKIVAAGYAFGGLLTQPAISRFLPSGAVDTTFGNQGSIILPVSASSIDTYSNNVVIQPDGKIVFSINSYEGNPFTAGRLNADGSFDNSFGTNGIASISIGPGNAPNALALQPDGKILIAGMISSGNVLARLNADGSPDASFGMNGWVLTKDPSVGGFPYDIAIQTDGKIIVSGSGVGSGTNFFTSRYTVNGALDTTFGGTGSVYTNIGSIAGAWAVAIQTDGKIVAGGLSENSAAAVRYNSNGTPDLSFGGDGKIVVQGQPSSHFVFRDLAIQSNGKLVFVGSQEITIGGDGPDILNAAVFRFNGDGSADTSFGANGQVVNPVGDHNSIYYSVDLLPNGKIIAGGLSSNGLNDDFTLVRYNGDLTGSKSPFDFDGDGKTDIGIFRPVGSASEWWINRSSTGQTFALQFGASTDKIAPADYTGDGKADIAFFRPSSGEWYVLRSEDFSFFALPFGTNGDVPVPADYDADGKADFAVFRPSSSTWFISQSSGAPTRIVQFGATGDQPVVADYDADGKADIGIFRPAAGGAEWWIQRSTAGLLALQFGASTDKAVQGDYTGDGKADVAVWKPSTGEWFIVRSEDSSFYGFPFGASTDTPAPGDYDGDGKFDATVFRPSSATWFIARSTAGTQIVQFGATGDQPIPNAFVP